MSRLDRDRAEILAVSDAWARAIVANDADRIARFMTDDWVIVSATGPQPREHFLSLVRSGRLTHSAMDRVGEAEIRVLGDVATLTARVTNVAHFDGQRFDADEWTTDVYVRRDAHWLCTLTHIADAA